MENPVIEFKYPKTVSTPAELTAKLKKFVDDVKPPEAVIKPIAFSAVPLKYRNVSDVDKLQTDRNVSDSGKLQMDPTNATAAGNVIMAGRGLSLDRVLGTLFTAALIVDYSKFRDSVQGVLKQAQSDEDKETILSIKKEGVAVFTSVFAQGGLKGITETDLDLYLADFLKDTKQHDNLVSIINTRQTAKDAKQLFPNPNKAPMGWIVPANSVQKTGIVGNFVLPFNLCQLIATPIYGSFTKHLGHTFNLQVTLSTPCVVMQTKTITIGWGKKAIKMVITYPVPGSCQQTYTIGSLTYNIDLAVGYEVTCCKGTAWGSASAQVCGTLFGNSYCVACNAGIVGAVGIAKSGSGSNCTYGIGLQAELKGTFGGFTVFDVLVPFGYTMQGPCPPLPC